MSGLERNMSLSLFNLYEEYIMRNAGLDGAQAGIKIAGSNIDNHMYACQEATVRTGTTD